MRPINVLELKQIFTTLHAACGSRLQEVMGAKQGIGLGFWRSPDLTWLSIDMSPALPVILASDTPLLGAKVTSPVQLFLNAHAKGMCLEDVRFDEAKGRVLELVFSSNTNHLNIEIHLIPHKQNILVQVGAKKISWNKPKVLVEANNSSFEAEQVRSWDEIRDEWLLAKPKIKTKKTDTTVSKSDLVLRKQKALTKMQQDQNEKQEAPWRELGDWLKNNQSLKVPDKWTKFIDAAQNLAWNIEKVFQKAKDNDRKIAVSLERMQLLQQEIADLNSSSEMVKKTKPTSILDSVQVQARRHQLRDDVEVVFGKSAKDNLDILRKAKPWHLWLHLRDYPSTHGIISFPKNAKIHDDEILKATKWLIQNAKLATVAKLAVVVCECRFVRPIKGDKLGRVNYHNHRILLS